MYSGIIHFDCCDNTVTSSYLVTLPMDPLIDILFVCQPTNTHFLEIKINCGTLVMTFSGNFVSGSYLQMIIFC